MHTQCTRWSHARSFVFWPADSCADFQQVLDSHRDYSRTSSTVRVDAAERARALTPRVLSLLYHHCVRCRGEGGQTSGRETTSSAGSAAGPSGFASQSHSVAPSYCSLFEPRWTRRARHLHHARCPGTAATAGPRSQTRQAVRPRSVTTCFARAALTPSSVRSAPQRVQLLAVKPCCSLLRSWFATHHSGQRCCL